MSTCLANKDRVVGCFFDRNYDKIFMEPGRLSKNIRVAIIRLGSVVDRMFKSSDIAFSTSPINLIHSDQESSSWPIAWRTLHMHP